MLRPKQRLLAAAGGVLFGLAGIAALTVAAITALAAIYGSTYAALIVGAAFITIGTIFFYAFVIPSKPAQEELEDIEHATAEVLADLSFDTIQAMVERHPLKVAGMAVVTGYSIINAPEETGNHIRKIVTGFM